MAATFAGPARRDSTSSSYSSKSNSNSCSSTTASQAWAILKRHARDEMMKLRLIELCQDKGRVSSLVSVYTCNATPPRNNTLMVDLSRQRMTLGTLNRLLRLASSRNVAKFIRQLSWGPNNDPDNPIIPARFRTSNNSSCDNKTGPQPSGTQNQSQNQHRHQNQNQSSLCETVSSYHMSLRVPSGRNYEMLAPDGTNVLVDIHNSWDRIRRISESLRRGKLPGVTGEMITDVIVVGRGIAIMALRFIYLALCKDEAASIGRRVGMHGRVSKGGGGIQQRRIKFLTTSDTATVVSDLDPESTLVLSIPLAGEEEATMVATTALRRWLLLNLGGEGQHHGRRSEIILSKHTMMVTGNKVLASKNKTESLFLIPDHCCEPYTTFTAATLLPLSIVFGWPVVENFLAGGHDIDSHFVETNPRHNLPVLLALTDVWNDCLQSTSNSTFNAGRIVTPYTEAFAGYPAFVAALESQICGRKMCDSNTNNNVQKSISSCCSSIVIDGGLLGIYDKSLYHASKAIPSELIMTFDSQLGNNSSLPSSQQHHSRNSNNQKFANRKDFYQSQDEIIVSLFAQADELAFGAHDSNDDHRQSLKDSSSVGITGGDLSNGNGYDNNDNDNGNRPSTILLCSRLDAFTCGQLVAMAEHRAAVKSFLCEIPFAGVQTSKNMLLSKRTEALKESLQQMILKEGENEEDGDENGQENGIGELNFSTRTILQHYANMARNQRINTGE